MVDNREAALKEAGDIVVPLEKGLITSSSIVAELGQVLAEEMVTLRTRTRTRTRTHARAHAHAHTQWSLLITDTSRDTNTNTNVTGGASVG